MGSTTRETFLGSSKDVNYGGDGRYGAGEADFTLPADQPDDSFALDGTWDVATQYATPVGKGRIRLEFTAAEVRTVVAGEGQIVVRLDDGEERTIDVSGTPRSYALVDRDENAAGILDVTVSPGLQVYSFTFG